jgi:hypothetical protein
MDLEQAVKWRRLLGRAGGLACLLVFLVLVDGLLVQFREPPNLLKVLPGTSTDINGPLGEEVEGVQSLIYESDSGYLTVTFDKIHKGYFLGGDMWRGRLTVGPQMAPGEYHLTVAPRKKLNPKAPPVFRIRVFADPLSLRQSSTSLAWRYLDVSPWVLAASLVPAILALFVGVFFLSQKLEALLAATGKAEIYRLIRQPEGEYEIRFGLGTRHGVHPGTRLTVYDEQGETAGTVEVTTATAEDAVAVVSADQGIKEGYLVSKY